MIFFKFKKHLLRSLKTNLLISTLLGFFIFNFFNSTEFLGFILMIDSVEIFSTIQTSTELFHIINLLIELESKPKAKFPHIRMYIK